MAKLGKGAYYGFKAQEDATVINWASVAKGLGDTLTTEAKRREDKKQSIDDASEELGDFIANAPLGGHKGALDATADLADQAQKIRTMQDRMLRDGELKQRDYNAMRGNTTKDVKALYASAAEFQKMYAEDIKRSGPNGPAALQETWMNSNLEGFLNPSTTQYRFNPETGELNLFKLDKDGNLDQSSGRPISAIQNDVRTRVDALDVDTAVSNMRKKLSGQFQKVIMEGDTKTISGVVDTPEFQKALDQAASSLIIGENGKTNSSSSALSVLTNYLGEYGIEDFITDPSKANENTILMVANPSNPSSGAMVPQLTEKQQKKAKEGIINAFTLAIGVKEDALIKTETKPTSTLLSDFSSLINSKIDGRLSTNEEDAETQLYNSFTELGFKFETTGFGTDKIIITSPEGETFILDLDLDNSLERALSFINLNTPLETKAVLVRGNVPNSKTANPSFSEWKEQNPNGTFTQYSESIK